MFYQIRLNSEYLKANWFIPAASIVILGNAAFLYIDGLQPIRWTEIGLLFDLAILIPTMYLICYRRQGRKNIIKAIGLACLGIWIVSKIIPEQDHLILERVAILRNLGLGVLFLIELRIMIAILKTIFSSEDDFEKNRDIAISEADMPIWISKVIAWEANIWRKVWLFFLRIFGK